MGKGSSMETWGGITHKNMGKILTGARMRGSNRGLGEGLLT